MKIYNWVVRFKSWTRQTAGVAILAGGMVFAGQACADTLMTEDFETAAGYAGGPGAAGIFALPFGGTDPFGAYNSAQDYSGDDHTTALGGTGGLFYGHTIGIPYPILNADFSAVDLALIAAGTATIDFDAWLASYDSDDDVTVFTADFYDAVGGAGGAGNLLGSITLADGTITNGDGDWTVDNWSRYITSNAVTFPTAVSVAITYGGAGGNGNDTYADNIVISINEGGAGPVVVAPDSVTPSRGDYVAGDVGDLENSDNMDYSMRRRQADTQSRTEFEVKSTSPTATPTTLEFTLEGAVFARSNVIQTVEFFDYDAQAWEEIGSADAARSPAPDSVMVVAGTGDLSRFVEDGTMCIETRVRYQSESSPRQNFASNTDQTIWTIE